MGTKTIWDGKDLPPIGCWVLIELASMKGQKLPYKVEGYTIRTPADEKCPKYYFLVDVHLRSRDNVPNQRSLDEVYPVDEAVMYGGKE